MSYPPTHPVLEKLGKSVVAKSGKAITGYTVMYGELNFVGPAARINDALRYLRDREDLALTQLIDIAGVDYPERPLRFDVVYHLLSMTKNLRVRLNVQTDEDTAVPSATPTFPNADWYEREAFDLYGILFNGHPDLRRLLTDYGFIGHPFRKDFPLAGYVEVRYDPTRQRVVYEPVSIEPRVVVPKTLRDDNRYAPGLTARPADRG